MRLHGQPDARLHLLGGHHRPLPDRIDIHIEAPRIAHEQLTDRREGERSADVRARVQTAPAP